MKLADWRAKLNVVAVADEGPDEAPLQNQIERSLARLWDLMQDPPGVVRAAYEDLHEREIQPDAERRAADLQCADFARWSPPLEADLRSLVRSIAVEVRALDKALMDVRPSVRPDNPNQAYRAAGDVPIFILPRPGKSFPVPRRGQAFDRRGLPCHRVLPATIDDLPVRLYAPSVMGPGADGSEAMLASAVFSRADPVLAYRNEGADFRVVGLENEGEVAAGLEAQLVGLKDLPPCMAIVWPELMLSPALQARLLGWLRDQALEDNALQAGILITGSWHLPNGDGVSNVAAVVDGQGAPILEIAKRQKFELKAGVLEDLIPGQELPVLIYGEALIAFGICKDFCERRFQPPYRQLDVDFVLVPSLGNAKTMDEHFQAAKNLAVGYGARSFVVQQLYERDRPGDLWGLVLRPAEHARGAPTAGAAQDIFLDHSRISCTIA